LIRAGTTNEHRVATGGHPTNSRDNQLDRQPNRLVTVGGDGPERVGDDGPERVGARLAEGPVAPLPRRNARRA
jgi:hypothetical protein